MKLEEVDLGWTWGIVGAVVAVMVFGVQPWDALRQVIEDQGANDETAAMIGVTAALTLPLCVAVTVLTIVALRGKFDLWSMPGFLLAAGILVGAAVVSRSLLVGLPVEFGTSLGGHPVALLVWAVDGYVNSYGFPLAISAAAIGLAGALTIERFAE